MTTAADWRACYDQACKERAALKAENERLQAQLNKPIDMIVHLYECGHVWQQGDAIAPKECPVCKLQAEVAAYRKALQNTLTWCRENDLIMAIDFLGDHLEKYLASATAGQSILDRLKAADRVVDAAKKHVQAIIEAGEEVNTLSTEQVIIDALRAYEDALKGDNHAEAVD